MKKLVFIDNNNKKSCQGDVDVVKNTLEDAGGLTEKYVESMKIIPDFHKIADEKVLADLLFSGKNCICTFSMYTASHYGSRYQLTKFLRHASMLGVKDIVYVDCSGMVAKALEQELTSMSCKRTDAIKILNAIETNYIITLDENNTMFRLRLELKGMKQSMFKEEKINLTELLSKK